MNLYWCIIQMASDLRRQQVCTITKPSYIFFPNQTFITGNKQGVVRGFEIQGELRERNCSILVLGSKLFPGASGFLSPWNTMAQMSPLVPRRWSLAVPQDVDCFSQEPGWALSVVSETKALTYALLTGLITIYLKVKFSNS